MKKIRTVDLKEGMMFDKPVYISGENLLVPPNVPVKKKDIDRLIRWEINEVETDGVLVTQTEVELIELQKPDGRAESQKKEGYEFYVSCVKKLEEIFKHIKLKNEERINQYLPAIETISRDIIDEAGKNQTKMLEYIAIRDKKENRMAISSVNCAILSTVVGFQLGLERPALLVLNMGALLHDVGMLRIQDAILNKKEKLKDEELRQIRTHTLLSYMIVSKELKLAEEVAACGIYHHEHWDGTGYPKRLKGEDIPLFARIVSVSDAYEAMVNKRPYREPLIGYSAIKNILNDNGTHFDPNILKIFLKCLGIYPIGSYVQLNNKNIGRVIDLNPAAPMRPTVLVFIDAAGKTTDQKNKIDLAENNSLFIVRPIDPETIGASLNEQP